MGQPVHFHLDPLGGVAGDMFLAALLDAHPEQAEDTFAAMRAAGLPDSWRTRLLRHDDGVLSGRRVVIEGPGDELDAPPGHFRDIRANLGAAPLRPAVRERAIAIFTAARRGRGGGAWRAGRRGAFPRARRLGIGRGYRGRGMADRSAGARELVGLPRCRSAAAASRPGTAHCLSRLRPWPACSPDSRCRTTASPGERVTPTGAAILRQLRPAPRLPSGPWRLRATGSGFGTRRLSGISNVLRVVVYDDESGWRQDERVAVLTFEVDDQSPEELALGLEALRAAEGVLDVVQLPAFGKKGRLVAHIQVLARPERLDAVIERCFVETTTIGLRWRIEARAVLAREVVEVATSDGAVPVKIVARPGGLRTAKAEIDQVRGDGHAVRIEPAARRRSAGTGR